MNKIYFENYTQETFAINEEWLKKELPQINNNLSPFYDDEIVITEGKLELNNDEISKEKKEELLYDAADIILKKAFPDIEASGVEFVESKHHKMNLNDEFAVLQTVQKKIKDAGAQDIIQVVPMTDDDFIDLDTGYINKEIIVNGKSYSNLIQTSGELEADIDFLVKGSKSVIPAERRYPELPCKNVLAARNEDGQVEGYVHMHMSDMIDSSYENFLDILSDALIGNACLQDITYSAVTLCDNEPNTIILKVSGYVDEADIG